MRNAFLRVKVKFNDFYIVIIGTLLVAYPPPPTGLRSQSKHAAPTSPLKSLVWVSLVKLLVYLKHAVQSIHSYSTRLNRFPRIILLRKKSLPLPVPEILIIFPLALSGHF